MSEIILIALWVLCAVVAYGLMFACFQNMFPELAEKDRCQDRTVALVMAVFGPVSLVTILLFFNRGQYGFKLW